MARIARIETVEVVWQNVTFLRSATPVRRGFPSVFYEDRRKLLMSTSSQQGRLPAFRQDEYRERTGKL
ncbi:hypothetical protein NKI45_30990, partial [Mesorhizobium sp. M0619]